LSVFLQPIKDDLVLKTPGVYSILCECGKVYIGQTGHLVETRVKEHPPHICLYQPEKPAVAQLSISLGHWIRLQNTVVLAEKMKKVSLWIGLGNLSFVT
jgi:predicted GIY-YIG superfamily endonuclease